MTNLELLRDAIQALSQEDLRVLAKKAKQKLVEGTLPETWELMVIVEETRQ